MKMTIDPVRAIDLNIDASLDFLSRVMPERIRNDQPFMRTVGQKRLLDLGVIHNVPEEHQPDPKYTAVKLKVKHEARKRLVPGSRKKYWERLEKSREEAWLHLSPDCAKIARCQTCADRRTGFAELKSSIPEDEEGGEWENIEDEPNAMSRSTGS
jgi:platelet-activating factor acetylhydrolase